ncbi:MAG TPA: hypothetical protein VFM49_26170 [Chloroflexia bacterium]|nr:hypothetical protein [Chloroflexia bacterium]
MALVLMSLLMVGLGAAGVRWATNGAGTPAGVSDSSADPDRFMPIPGGEGGEAAELAKLETDWNNRITYPTGRFDPAWVQQAAAQDRKVQRNTPAGAIDRSGKTPPKGNSSTTAPLALDPTSFTPLGPAPLRMTGCSGCYNYTTTAGRVNTIAIDPVASNVAYLGSVGGGVWKTTNCCGSSTSWSAVTDDPLLTTISIDDITIDPSNHNTVYAGTGDLNYGSFSMGSQGILKSTDSGASWTVIGADVFGAALPQPPGNFPQYQAVGKVRVDPRNSNNVVAGTKTGLYFSYDGGTNWTGPCTTNSFGTQRQDITDLVLTDMGGSTRIIAAVGVRGFATPVQYNLDQNGANGLYKGTMPAGGCPTDFTLISTNSNGWAGMNAGSGTPYAGAGSGDQLGRINIAVAPSNPNYIYAQVQAITPSSANGCGGAQGCQLAVWRTTNGGATWTQLPGSLGSQLKNCANGGGDYSQNWYDQAVAVDPNNPDRVFISTFDIWFWSAGATSFNDVTCGYSYSGSAGPVHVDQHALAFVPGSSSILLAGHDGGVNMTGNAQQVTTTVDPAWVNLDNGLNTIEFYSGDISGFFATSPVQMANGGAQDNGSSTVKYTNGAPGPAQWQMGTGGDGFYARIDPVAGRFWQGGNSGGVTRCIAADCTQPGISWSLARGAWTGDTQAFQLPYEIFKGTPGDPANDCAPAPAGCNHLIAGTTRVWETINGDAAAGTPVRNSWYVNSPANLTKQTLGNRSYINQLAYAPSISNTAIVGTNDGNVQYGFGLGRGAANPATWVNVTGGNTVLPNRPILDVTIDPSTSTTAYASVGGFNANTPSTPGHIFQVVCSANCASFTWTDKTGNLPDIPADSIIANPRYPQQVFAGTDFGLYFTNDITAASPVWYRFQNGLPNVMIWDMQIDRGGTTLSVWTRGRGAYVWPLADSPVKGSQAISFAPLADKTFGDPDFAVNASATSGLPVSLSAGGACTVSGSTVHITGAGSCTITATQDGDENYYPATPVVRTFSIARRTTTTQLTVAPSSVQYSDVVAISAAVSPSSAGGQTLTGGVEFFLNNVSLGVVPLDANGNAALDPIQITLAPNSTGYDVRAEFTTSNPNFTSSNSPTRKLPVLQEDARAYYIGNMLFWGTTAGATSANVSLAATIKDITAVAGDPAYDASAGDIRNATVTFVNRDSGNAAISGCANLPVVLVNGADPTIGTATCATMLAIGNSGASQYNIGIVVSGYYTRNNAADDVVIDVAQPLTTNFFTGGGYLTMSNSAGLKAGDAGSKTNFGFHVKYNRAGTNLQGSANIVVRSGGRVYQIKSNSLTSITVNPVTGQATFNAKANIQDITDPQNPVTVEGNASLQLTMTDRGEPGANDTLGITVWNRNGALWYASNWNGTRTVEQVLGGGNLAVH